MRLRIAICALLVTGLGCAQSPERPQATQRAAPMARDVRIALEVVAEGLVSPAHLTAPSGDARRFVVDRPGTILILDAAGQLVSEPFLDLTKAIVPLRKLFDERGLLGLAFHPNYAENGRFFVHYSAPLRESAPQSWDHTSRISEFIVSEDDPNRADPGSERVLLEVDQPQFNHNAGTLAFSPVDGLLYIALGDGGAANDVGPGHPPMGHGQDITSLLGSMLRIDVDRGWPGYAIPQDNPFVGREGIDETHSWGWRNPWRMSFDRGGDHGLYVATNGQHLVEAIYRADEPGNYGWNRLEGSHCFDARNPDRTPEQCDRQGPRAEPVVMPIIEYPHPGEGAETGVRGISCIGGYIYRGRAIPALTGRYVFGDWSRGFETPQGQVLVATPDASGRWSLAQQLQIESFVLGFGEDAAGELYVLTTDNTGPTGKTGKVLKIVARR